MLARTVGAATPVVTNTAVIMANLSWFGLGPGTATPGKGVDEREGGAEPAAGGADKLGRAAEVVTGVLAPDPGAA